MNRVAVIVFSVGLLFFGVFNFVPFIIFLDPAMATPTEGWRLWGKLVDAVRHGSLEDSKVMISWAALLCGELLIVTSPFLVPVFRLSRLAWWIAMLLSGCAVSGVVGVMLLEPPPASIDLGLGCYSLIAALALNFLGFFFIRREIPPNPVTGPR